MVCIRGHNVHRTLCGAIFTLYCLNALALVEFYTAKAVFGRNVAEYRNHSVGLPVHVSGVYVRAEFFGKLQRVVYHKVGRRDQQSALGRDKLVVRIEDKLISKYLGTVFDVHKMFLYLRIKRHSVIKTLKKADQMYVLRA